jgi:endonuclease YncB( thermonuclease family)
VALTDSNERLILRHEASCVDRFGRTLAYVATSAGELNTGLVREGYACERFIPPAGSSRAEEFATYDAEARPSRVGMWGTCASIPCDR